MVYLPTFTIQIHQMLNIPYMDPMVWSFDIFWQSVKDLRIFSRIYLQNAVQGVHIWMNYIMTDFVLSVPSFPVFLYRGCFFNYITYHKILPEMYGSIAQLSSCTSYFCWNILQWWTGTQSNVIHQHWSVRNGDGDGDGFHVLTFIDFNPRCLSNDDQTSEVQQV